MRIRERPQRHKRGDDWNSGKFRKLPQLLCRTRLDYAATGVNDRFFRLRDELDRLRDLAVMWLGRWLISRQIERSWKRIVQVAILNVFRDIH